MEKIKKYYFWPTFSLVLFIFLQATLEFHLFYMEQYQLFILNKFYFTEKLFILGGLTDIFADFLLQFFIYPYAGALIVTLLLLSITILTYNILKQINSKNILILSLLPTVGLLCTVFDFNYNLQSTIAYFLFILAFYYYIKINSYAWRLIYSLFLAVLLFIFAGPIAILFPLTVVLWDILTKRKYPYISIISIVAMALCGILTIHFSFIANYKLAFLPDFYFFVMGQNLIVSYLSWILYPITLLLAWILSKQSIKATNTMLLKAIQCILIIMVFAYGLISTINIQSLKYEKLDYLSRTEQWNKIIDISNNDELSNYHLCYLNMALAQKGILGEIMFHYPNQNPSALFCEWDYTQSHATLLSDIYYMLGNTGLAQQMAFEGNLSAPKEMNGRLMTRLIQTNMIYSQYPVAKKYIDLLGQTLYYRTEASMYNQMMSNNEAIVLDSTLLKKRMLLPSQNYLHNTYNIQYELEQMVKTSPHNNLAFQYLCAYYLLSKQTDKFKSLVYAYYGTEVLPTLPTSYAEAILLSETNPEILQALQLPLEMVERYDAFNFFITQDKDNPSLLQTLKEEYGNTYWYYHISKELQP